jgi:uncharacterized membrane protein YhhN
MNAVMSRRSSGRITSRSVAIRKGRRAGTAPFNPVCLRSVTVESWWVLTAAAGLAAVADWWFVHAGRRDLERWLKPLTMGLLVAVAAAAGDLGGVGRALLVVGAVFGLLGDVALLGEGESAFMAGLGAFAVGHLAYVGAAIAVGFEVAWTLPGVAFMLVMLGFRFASRIVPGAHRAGGPVLAGAVVVYACVISAMVVTAWATTVWVAAAGAMLFAASDWVLGHQRFAGPLPGGRLAVMVPYHLGQALLIVGLATAS